MNTRRYKIQRAVLVLAVAALASAVLPNPRRGIEPAGEKTRAALRDGGVSNSALNGALASLPLSFEPNRGQADADVKFVGRGDGFALLLKRGEAVMALQKKPSRDKADGQPSKGDNSPLRLSMRLDGANNGALVSGSEQQQARANYFIGSDPAKWIRGIETYSRVNYASVYPGIDLMFYGNQRQLEYDFTVAPGADCHAIKLRFEGANDLELNSKGELILHTAAGEVRHHRPLAYQERGGARLEIQADFERMDNGAIGFRVGDYDRTLPLVIDPILVYSTYVGGAAGDTGRGIVADSAGNAYLVGDSFSSDFLFRASAANSDVFVGKLNASGSLLNYTFFGGMKNDVATGLAVDALGNVYLCGETESEDFPLLNSIGFALRGESDVFVIKLTPLNTAPDNLLFEYSSLVGGAGEEGGASIAIDAAGSAYITGQTTSQDFPTVAAIQPVFGGGDSDAFISKLAPDGKSFLYSSFLGGSGAENSLRKTGISVDAPGNAYVAGDTGSSNFPTKNALRAAKTGSASSLDGFAVKVNPGGSDFVYSTYLGGSDDDSGLGIANDQTGNAYVTGRTRSTTFTGSTSTRPSSANTDAFVAKLNPSGSALSYLTFIGGGGNETGNAIAVDTAGNAVIAGAAGAGSPTVNSIQSFFKGGPNDALVAKLGTTGGVSFSTYVGGSGDDFALGVGLDPQGAIYITGFTTSTDLLTASPLRSQNAGARDILIAKIDPNTNGNSPVLLQALISGKHLIIFGQNFAPGAVLRINDEPAKTRNDDPDPTQILFAKKAAKRIGAGETVQLQIENPNGKRSNFLFLRKPL